MPSERTFYRLAGRLASGRHTIGSARTRRSLARQPDGPFGTVTAARPGEWTQVDSTPLDAGGARRRHNLAVGADVGIPGLRPHRCRHTFGTRLRQGGADSAQVQALLGHASLYTAARYFRSGSAENAAVIERTFDR